MNIAKLPRKPELLEKFELTEKKGFTGKRSICPSAISHL